MPPADPHTDARTDPRADPRIERSRDLERLLTFVDAIAAVAITLLVLPLVDLATHVDSSGGSVAALVRAHSGQFWSFVLSFLVIARLWLAQHALVRPAVAANRTLTIGLLLWAFAMVFLPFPTALLPNAGSQATTKILYIGTLIAGSLCLAAVALTLRRNRKLRDTDAAPDTLSTVVVTGLLTLALLLTLVAPRTGYYPLLLLQAEEPIVAALRRLSGRSRRPDQHAHDAARKQA